jgi:hypothetical protein
MYVNIKKKDNGKAQVWLEYQKMSHQISIIPLQLEAFL